MMKCGIVSFLLLAVQYGTLITPVHGGVGGVVPPPCSSIGKVGIEFLFGRASGRAFVAGPEVYICFVIPATPSPD
jgi:hypothetical protein